MELENGPQFPVAPLCRQGVAAHLLSLGHVREWRDGGRAAILAPIHAVIGRADDLRLWCDASLARLGL
eukprot:8928596-Pyramimonas_sp.AAC.1